MAKTAIGHGIIVSLVAGLLLTTLACGEGEDGVDIFSCSFEERNTACNSTIFGPWEADCATIDFELIEGLSQSDFCAQTFPPTDSETQAECTVLFEFRNVVANDGACP